MISSQLTTILFFFFLVLLHQITALSHDHSFMLNVERSSLLNFKSTMSPAPPTTLSNWNDSTHVCNFTGVHCNRWRLHVTGLHLGQLSIQAPISPYLANLTDLRLLNLSGNLLTGQMPEELTHLRHLSVLDLASNNLEGPIPKSISRLRSLELLDLSENLLTGQIPEELAHLRRLSFVKLASNSLEGPIPESLSDLSVLQFLDFSENQLTGHIPEELVHLSQLIVLKLASNSLEGPIPQSVSPLSSLMLLDLSTNQLTGQIPGELSSLQSLTILDLSFNNLNGSIPESISLLNSLSYLSLSTNSLGGKIPTAIFHNCTSLSVVDLSNNSLVGDIPSEEGIHLPSLNVFNVYLNYLRGQLPQWLSNSSIEQLDVGYNNISGELPTELVQKWSTLDILHLSYTNLRSHDNNTNLEPFFLALSNCTELQELEMEGVGLGGHLPRRIGQNMTKLSSVILDNNKISGPIPPDIANIWNVTILNLSTNLLYGTIPNQLGQLLKLERLILSVNFLDGPISSALGKISSIGLLDLSDNKLSGEIPESLGNLRRISQLYLHKNHLSGEIPVELGNCQNLNQLDLSYNRLTGRIPEEISGIAKIYLNLSNNLLQGNLPTGLSKMDQVEEIDLSSNNLTGIILPLLSECHEAKLINLSHNSLQGKLPESLGSLRSLETLDLSYNSLSGEIPLSLINCISLTKLNLSYNDFIGTIPTAGVFLWFTSLSFLGNPKLCGPAMGRACPQTKKLLHSGKFLITVCISASVLAFLSTICCVIRFRKIKSRILTGTRDIFGSSSPVLQSSYPRITYRELVEATEDFQQHRLVGSGSYGRVYRGVLKDGTVVAVKVLQLQTGNSTRSFNRECHVLKRIRHRNLMRIITACSLPDFKALVLPYMANGSLHSRLYGGSEKLSLVHRVSILSDVAEGMAYLHHYSPEKVIHCDLKPSNVLLNDEMTALVSDFGIARLVRTVGSGNTIVAENAGTSTANLLCGSIGYIAPEYGFGSNPSTMGDVYSFGIIVLEVVTRKIPTDEMFEGGLNLHKWVKNNYHGGVEKVIDISLVSDAKDQTPEVRRMWEVAIAEMIELGLLCTQENASTRPTMLDAADDLDRLKTYLAGDTTATFASSLGMSSSTFGED